MVEPTQREVDQALASSMKMFERVQLGEVTPIEPRPIERLLLALDGSTQDVTATAIARALARRFSAKVSVLAVCARAEQVAARAVQEMGAGAIVPATGHKDNFEEILAAIKSTKPDLVLAPCPFGRDFEQIGPDSAGTVVDVLIARSGVPLLVIREPHEVEKVPFRSAALTLVGENAAAPDAAAWAATLVAPGGHFELVLVLEEEFHENVTRLLESMADHAEPTSAEFSAALQKAHVRLHRALQKSASQAGFDYSLSVMQEDEARAFLQQDFASLSLIVVALERPHHVSQGYASHCVRHSRQPVLIVPSG
jgi:uncharacterized protein with PIN domain